MATDGEPWTVKRLLAWSGEFFARKEVDSPRLSAEMLLGHVLGVPRIKLYTNFERAATADELARYRDLVRRAAEHEPIAYLTGRAPFFNLDFIVTRDTLIPRPDTEVMVEHVLQDLRLSPPPAGGPRVLDLCTGSGCIACALAVNLKGAAVAATDLSPPAVEVARANVAALALADRVTVLHGDLYAALDALPDPGPFDVIVSNPPYIPTARVARLDRSVRDYEPRRALDGGDDGLSLHRRILAGAPGRLGVGGRVYLEIDEDHGDAARAAAAEVGMFEGVRVLKDGAGHDRVLAARLK